MKTTKINGSFCSRGSYNFDKEKNTVNMTQYYKAKLVIVNLKKWYKLNSHHKEIIRYNINQENIFWRNFKIRS